MKRLIMLSVLTLLSATYGRTIVFETMVAKSQTEELRKQYYGKDGELVRNQDRPDLPLTVYDGVTVGGFPLMVGIAGHYHVKKGATAVENGDNLIAAFAFSNGRPDDDPLSIFIPVGDYDLQDTTITNEKSKVSVCATSFVKSYFDWLTYSSPDAAYANITGNNPTIMVDSLDDAYTHYQNIRFEEVVRIGSMSASVKVMYMTGVEVLGVDSRAFFDTCEIYGYLEWDNFKGSLLDCWISNITNFDVEQASLHNTVISSGVTYALGANTPSGATTITLRDASISAANIFWQGTAANCTVIAHDTLFEGSSNTWIIGPASEFWNCKGVDPSISTKAGIIVGCIDRNGDRVPDKP